MPRKLDRCVRKVRRSLKEAGKKGNPYAICKAALKKKKRHKKKSRRKR